MSNQTTNRPARLRGLFRSWKTWERIFAISMFVFAILALPCGVFAVISAISDLPGAIDTIKDGGRDLGLPLDTQKAKEGEFLILIATFRYTENVNNTDVHTKIQRSITSFRDELGLSNLRAEVVSTQLSADEREGAEKLGHRYNASIVIWGEDTGVEIIANYENITDCYCETYFAQIPGGLASQIASPKEYSRFVVEELPPFLARFSVGDFLLHHQQYEQAAAIVEEGIGLLSPETTREGLDEAMFRLGWVYQGPLGNVEKAAFWYNESIKANEDYLDAYYNLGSLKAELNLPIEASNYFERMIAIDPKDPRGYIGRGSTRIMAVPGDTSKQILMESIDDFDTAIDLLGSDLSIAYTSRALARAELGDSRGAREDYEHVFPQGPQNSFEYFIRGSILSYLGDLTGAEDDLNRALDLNPADDNAYIVLGSVQEDLNEFEGALQSYSNAINLGNRDAGIFESRASVREHLNDMQGAIDDYTQAIAFDPERVSLYISRGIVFDDLHRPTDAIKDFEVAIQLQPDNPYGYYNLAVTQAKGGREDTTSAEANYSRAISVEPGFAEAYFGRGNLRSSQNRFSEAIQDYTEAISIDPQLASAYYNRGMARRAIGQLQSALGDFRQCLAIDPQNRDRDQINMYIAELTDRLTDGQ